MKDTSQLLNELGVIVEGRSHCRIPLTHKVPVKQNLNLQYLKNFHSSCFVMRIQRLVDSENPDEAAYGPPL